MCLVVAIAASVLLVAGPASADKLQDCIDQANAQGIDNPTCVDNGDGKLTPVVSDDGFDDDFNSDPGIPAGFIVLFVVMGVLIVGGGLATTYWRMQVARKIATDSGMDPDVATGVALLDHDGLSTAYLVSNLHPKTLPASAPAPAPAPSTGSATDRLNELKRLLDDGLITQVEYDDRRKAIVDSL